MKSAHTAQVETGEHGEYLVKIPDELWEGIGWEIGDEIDVALEKTHFVVTNLSKSNRSSEE